MKKVCLLILFLTIPMVWIQAQGLHPGFDAKEYLQLLQITRSQTADLYPPDSSGSPGFEIPSPKDYQMVYRSPEVGLFNRWALWLKKDSSIAVISIRGTVMKEESWMENFFAAMVSATGKLQLNDSTAFTYKLAENQRAAVHAGWLTGLAYISPSVIQQIKKYAQIGVKNFIIFGHSQGGAIAFLLRSYLEYLPESVLPKGLNYKTYCSAAPKPGNLYYAYDFDYVTRGGWGYRVVNERDWVPESPFSLQTLRDFNDVNPFIIIKPALKKLGFLPRLYLGHVFGRMDRMTKKTSKRIRKDLGDKVYKQVHKTLPEFPKPHFVLTTNYSPAGYPVILRPYSGYDEQFKFNGKNVFVHHALKAYYLMTLRDY